MTNGLKAVVDRKEGEFWILKISGDQELYWLKNITSINIKEGDVVNLYLSLDEVATINQEESAKNLLKQIFQPNV